MTGGIRRAGHSRAWSLILRGSRNLAGATAGCRYRQNPISGRIAAAAGV